MLYDSLNRLGVFDFILPWLFAFTLSYYLLGLVFKDGNKPLKRINIVLSSIIAFFFIAYKPAGTDIREVFTGLFGEYSVYAIIGLAVLVILRMFEIDYLLTSPLAPIMSLLTGKEIEKTKKDKKWSGLVAIAIIAIMVFVFSRNVPMRLELPDINSNFIALIAIMAMFIYLMSLFTKDRGGKNEDKDVSGGRAR